MVVIFCKIIVDFSHNYYLCIDVFSLNLEFLKNRKGISALQNIFLYVMKNQSCLSIPLEFFV